MPEFGAKSKARLATCHRDLRAVCNKVIPWFNFTVLEGQRKQADQDKAFAKGRSKVKWPNGKHNKSPSEAVDIAPYPIDWLDRERFCLLAGAMMQAAEELGIDLRWGGDWDGNPRTDNKFDDLPHFELRALRRRR